MTVDPYWEQELNPRLSVPDAADHYGVWPHWAAATRAARPHAAGIRYGAHPRETLDIFRAAEPKGAVLFIHGGYWRAFSKDDFSWVADGFVDQGLTVAVVSYPLCPEATLGGICESLRGAFAHLWREELGSAERARLAVTGHSAGGYLTALMLATDWSARGLPADPIRAAVPISGVFELENLIPTSMNEAIGLDVATARALSLTGAPPRSRARLVATVGGAESAEFHRQSDALAAAWSSLAPSVVDMAGKNHFTVIEDLRVPGAALQRIIVDALDQDP